MKSALLIALAGFCAAPVFSQTITWSPDLVTPKETEVNSLLTFPGTDKNNYYVDESVFGTETMRRKWKDYIKTVDKATLKLANEADLSGEVAEDGKKYFNVKNFVAHNRSYNFFIDMNDKDVYNVYASVRKIDDTKTPVLRTIQKVDITYEKALKPYYGVLKKKESKEDAALKAGQHVEIEPAYDGKSIISAFIYQAVDEDNSMLNISEWDAELKATISNNYKIPFRAMETSGGGINPYLGTFVKDNNGFVYVVVNSANPDEKNKTMSSTLYQFKLSDASYVKTYKKELGQNKNMRNFKMFQNESGKVFVAATGREDGDDNYSSFTNAAYIGSFGAEGRLQTIFFKHLSTDMMYNFETEKIVDKRDGVETLYITDILPSADGGCFVIWERVWVKTKENMVSNGRTTTTRQHSYYNNDNLLIQYFSNTNKMIWQKPVYKDQKRAEILPNIYSKLVSTIIDGGLYIFYPDDPRNASKAVDDKDVAEYDISRFSSKDLAGMFVARFDINGTYTRKYINWPEDRIGFALCTNSLRFIGNGECIGTVRKIKQSLVSVRSEEYTFFKLKF